MPGNHVDEALWEKAKSKVDHSKYKDNDSFYAVVTTVYKNLGGKFTHEDKKSKYDGIITKI